MQPIFYICGPTASQKTALSVSLTQSLPKAVFINADSMQVYKGLESVACHPTEEEFSQMDHRLFSIRNLRQDFGCAEWLGLATKEVKTIFNQGKIPILIGGSKSYASCLAKAVYGIDLNEDKAVYTSSLDQVHFITLMPQSETIEDNIKERAELYFDSAVRSVKKALDSGYDYKCPGFLAIGTKEIKEYMAGEVGREAAILSISEKTELYMREQLKVFHDLYRKLASIDSALVLKVAETDCGERSCKVLEFINTR